MRRTPMGGGLELAHAVVAVVCAVGLAAAPGGSRDGIATDPASPRVAIFAVDAADWLTIDRLVAQGHLPTFGRLKQVAALGVLQADAPLLSPIIWTTMATGREPTDHGVLDFMADVPGGGQAPVSARARRAKAIWEIWSQAGWPVAVTGWWATWPADRVRGVLVSDRLAGVAALTMAQGDRPPPAIRGAVYPPEVQPEIAAMVVAPDSLDYRALSRFVPMSPGDFARAVDARRPSPSAVFAQPIAHLRGALAATRSCRAISTWLAARHPASLWAAYYELVDIASHLFTRDRVHGEAVIAAAYDEIDEALAETARVLAGDTCVIVISDHGFYPPAAGIREDPADLTAGAAAWHRPYGIVAVTTAAALRDGGKRARPSPIGRMSPLDLVPSLLARAGLPLAADMTGRVIPAIAGTTNTGRRIASYGGHDLQDTAVVGTPAAEKAEVERLRALGYISGQRPTGLGRVNLGEYLYRKRDLDGARRELEAVLRSDPLNTRAALWLARTYADAGRPDDALRLYDRLITLDRQSREPHIDPLVYLAATDLDLASRRAQAAIERLRGVPAPLRGTPELLTARGAVADAQGRPAEAERCYRDAQAASPEDVESLERLVDLLIRTGRAPEAVSVAAATVQRFPSSPIRLSIAGESELARRHFREAERYFAAALGLAPDSLSVRVALARSRLLDGRPDAALDTLNGMTASRDVEVIRGTALAEQRNWTAAVSAYERAAAFGPPGVDLLNALGHAYFSAGRSRDAVTTLERSLAVEANQPSIRDLLQRARRAAQVR